MVDPVVIGMSPNRKNICFSVQPYIQLDEFSQQVVEEIRHANINTPKTVIFCQSFTNCYQLYDKIRTKLKADFTYPSGYPDFHAFRLVEMYHGGCMPYVREQILKTFTSITSHVRVVIATSSFGMGIDCPDIYKVIHWGTPEDIEQYVQETGRAGRDGKPSDAILYHKVQHSISDSMQSYCSNESECRRVLLLEGFIFYDDKDTHSGSCDCCDICKRMCI